jgi:TolA-binding protein
MSFSKTVSIFAALCSIFGAGAAGWKLSQESQVKPTEEVNTKYEQHITELQQQISGLEDQLRNTNHSPVVNLPPQQQTQVAPPATPQLPPPPQPPVPPKPFE